MTNSKFKKIFYILAFTFLGILLQFLLHAIIEGAYIGLLTSDFAKYGLGLSWDDWYLIHFVFTIILFIGGVVLGFWQGKYWWKRIYEDKVYDK